MRLEEKDLKLMRGRLVTSQLRRAKSAAVPQTLRPSTHERPTHEVLDTPEGLNYAIA